MSEKDERTYAPKIVYGNLFFPVCFLIFSKLNLSKIIKNGPNVYFYIKNFR